jgi:hypothetical protein
MKQHQLLIVACALAVLLSILILWRSFAARKDFDLAVNESLKITEGYDQRFIDRVNRLEELLATRAQFGYSGGKDPMTGTLRQVVQQRPAPAPVKYRPIQRTSPGETPVAVAPAPAQEAPDQMRLTAIIADASGKKITAIVMDGERSFSVEKGDMVGGRKITHITNEGIYMEADTMMYFYDIYGNVVKKSKESGRVSSVLKEEPTKQETPEKLQPAPIVPKQQQKQPKPRQLAPRTNRK